VNNGRQFSATHFFKSQKAEIIHDMLAAQLAKHVVQKNLRII